MQYSTEAEFLDAIGTMVLRAVLLAIFTVVCSYGFYSPQPYSKSGLKLVCNVNFVYGKLKFENFQDYAQKPHRNFSFINSTSVQEILTKVFQL
jgi:hypothetical protein